MAERSNFFGDDRELTYRAAMLPMGTYRNDDGSESVGWAWPGMINEPYNAFQRLAENSITDDGSIGIPNPQNPDNQRDVLTGLLSFYGGNALNAATLRRAAVESASALPSTRRHTEMPNGEWFNYDPVKMAASEARDPLQFNEAVGDWNLMRREGGEITYQNPLIDPEAVFPFANQRSTSLHSDTGRPSLWGSALAAENSKQRRPSIFDF